MQYVDFFGHKVSKLICGDNPFNGHSYITDYIPGKEMVDYHTEDKILEAMHRMEELGINTMLPLSDPYIIRILQHYRNNGGKMNFIFQIYCPMMFGESFDVNMRLMNTVEPIGVYIPGSTVDVNCEEENFEKIHHITKKIREHMDCLAWVDFAVSHFGPNCRIILTGISMGASTVLMAAGKKLPDNVIGVLADCGFHSAKDVICSVAESMHLPSRLLYPFVKFGAKFFGHFDLEEYSPVEGAANCKIPVIFFHGLNDDYVPSYMSQMNFDACRSKKRLIYIPGAGHGLAFPVAPDRYLSEMMDFFYGSHSILGLPE